MSTDDPGRGGDEETTNPYSTSPPQPPSDFDPESTTPLGRTHQPQGSRNSGPTPPQTRQTAPPTTWGAGPPPAVPPTRQAPMAGPPLGPGPGRPFSPNQPPPQGFPPPQGYQTPPIYPQPPRRDNRKWYLILGAAVVAILVVVASIVLLRNDDDTAGQTTAKSSSLGSATSTTSATPTPASVDPAGLPQLLLPADAISTIMGSPGMEALELSTQINVPRDSSTDPLNCSAAWGPGKAYTYQISGFIGLARQGVTDKPVANHGVVQTVIAFPDATAARKSYDSQLKAWSECQYRTLSSHVNETTPDQTAVVGGTGEVDGIATLQLTPNLEVKGIVCQRALTPVGNVIVDVRACSLTGVADNPAVAIARDIAAKITNG